MSAAEARGYLMVLSHREIDLSCEDGRPDWGRARLPALHRPGFRLRREPRAVWPAPRPGQCSTSANGSADGKRHSFSGRLDRMRPLPFPAMLMMVLDGTIINIAAEGER